MRKVIILTTILLGLFLSSCKTQKINIANKSQKELKGMWTLSSIEMDQNNIAEIKSIFGEDKTCFEGSTWRLIPNNNTGYYTLTSPCSSTEQNFKWYIEEVGSLEYFAFKKLNEGEKGRDVKTGYKMQVISSDENQIHLMHEVPFEDQKASIHLYFDKQNQ